jgi:oligoendopeptidase F
MIAALYDNRSFAQKSVTWLAKHLGEVKLSPWNMLTSAPVKGASAKVPFETAIHWIKESFANIDPELGQFVQMMRDKKLIEGRVNSKKVQGGYCSSFLQVKLPIVYQNYSGSMNDVLTLAHELGHAFHYWSLKEKPLSQQEYPSTLAETASIFGETIFLNDLLKASKNKEERFNFVWGEVERFVAFTLNIPVRYEFDYNFHEARKTKSVQSEEMQSLYEAAWRKWYGDTLSTTDNYYWAHKLHFSMSSNSFYNFPYTFGYLFAVGIYARKEEWGKDFYKKYQQILSDTGLMTCEELVQKHFGEDITEKKFWSKTLNFINQSLQEKMTGFEN